MDIEPLYCAEQIAVPESLPDVLKRWTKAAIRENPADIVAWSAEYVAWGGRKRTREGEAEGVGGERGCRWTA
jgi:hypothetical protein